MAAHGAVRTTDASRRATKGWGWDPNRQRERGANQPPSGPKSSLTGPVLARQNLPARADGTPEPECYAQWMGQGQGHMGVSFNQTAARGSRQRYVVVAFVLTA